MGGDFAPQATVAGALLALGELEHTHIVQLVGQAAVINEQLDRLLGGEMSASYRQPLGSVAKSSRHAFLTGFTIFRTHFHGRPEATHLQA